MYSLSTSFFYVINVIAIVINIVLSYVINVIGIVLVSSLFLCIINVIIITKGPKFELHTTLGPLIICCRKLFHWVLLSNTKDPKVEFDSRIGPINIYIYI